MSRRESYHAAVCAWLYQYAGHPHAKPVPTMFGLDTREAENIELYGAVIKSLPDRLRPTPNVLRFWESYRVAQCKIIPTAPLSDLYRTALLGANLTCPCPITLRTVNNEDIMALSKRTGLSLHDLLAARSECQVCMRVHKCR